MPNETHKLQEDAPEGSRKVIEHELERQARKSPGEAGQERSESSGESGGQTGREGKNGQ